MHYVAPCGSNTSFYACLRRYSSIARRGGVRLVDWIVGGRLGQQGTKGAGNNTKREMILHARSMPVVRVFSFIAFLI